MFAYYILCGCKRKKVRVSRQMSANTSEGEQDLCADEQF